MSIWKEKSDPQWGELAKRSESFVDYLTAREDIVVLIEPDLRDNEAIKAEPIPAGCFYPSYARMNVDASQTFETVLSNLDDINPMSVTTQINHPRFVGVLVHESAHAKHTLYDFPQVPNSVAKWITLLEEIRCEYNLLQSYPQYAKYIKTIVKTIVAKETFDVSGLSQKIGDRYSAAHTAILVLGRVESEVFEEDEVKAIAASLDKQLSGDLNALKKLWISSLEVDDLDADGLVSIAEKIAKIIDPDDDGGAASSDAMAGGMPCGSYAPGGNPDPNSSSSPQQSSAFEGILDELDKLTEKAKQEIAESFSSEKYALPESVSEKNEKKRIQIQQAASKISPTPDKPSNSRMGGWGYSGGNLLSERPTATDIGRSRTISQALKKAQYRDVKRTTSKSQLPPGRFVIREAMNRHAQISNGQAITATPWNQIKRRTVDNPPITVAVATDISGSMGAYQREVASFTWALANAIQKLNGSVGAIAWNGAGGPIREMIKPNSRISETINYYTAGGGSDGLPGAIKAADGLMNLGFGEGVRVLAVITDGELPNMEAVRKEITYLVNQGVLVLWILTSSRGARVNNAVNAVLKSPEDFGRIVGPKIIETLQQA